ncbi:MAG TPA: hypothetical protein VMT24_01495 [Aggregatilineaceae bacterium]|jgi:hypothetical protein|nr:hypothetical protein [Aggregatilineaceae bacterium]
MNPDDLNTASEKPQDEAPAQRDEETAPVTAGSGTAPGDLDAVPVNEEDTLILEPLDKPAEPAEEPEAAAGDEKPGEPAPISAAPPRIVGETPLGGMLKPPLRPAVAELGQPLEAALDAEAAIPGEQEATAQPGAESSGEEEPVQSFRRDISTVPGTVKAHEVLSQAAGEPSAPEAEISEQGSRAAEQIAPEGPQVAVLRSVSTGEREEPPAPPARDTAPQAEPQAAKPEEWDEDLSPELSAVLFGGSKPTPAAARPEAAREAPRAGAVPEPARPAVTEAPAETVMLTDIADTRRVPITAQGHRAAAPEASLQGKARYMRVEEPLKKDRGQRITESWEYFKPQYPALDGRLVRAVHIEEISYADGSWFWRYERTYTDKGRDRREVRANTDHTYIERQDEVSKLQPETTGRIQFKEKAALILAAPQHEEKRGFLSGLLGRDNDQEQAAKTWRDATSSEARHARKHGGMAF